MAGWTVLRADPQGEDDAEAWGPFSSRQRAERFAEDFGYWVNPGYEYVVAELYPVRDGDRQIQAERRFGD